MYRLLLNSLITLRVIACPIFCVGVGDVASAAGMEQIGGCHCGHEQSTPCDGNRLPPPNAPSDNPCPCEAGCVCQVTPEANNRTASADILLSLDVTPLSIETLDLSKFLTNPCVERNQHRFDLQSGRDVRLVYASLLL